MHSIMQKALLVIPYVTVIQYSERMREMGAEKLGLDGGSKLKKKENRERE